LDAFRLFAVSVLESGVVIMYRRHARDGRCAFLASGTASTDALFNLHNLDRLALSSLQPQGLFLLSDCESPGTRDPMNLLLSDWCCLRPRFAISITLGCAAGSSLGQ
jgi:hypothetical protein